MDALEFLRRLARGGRPDELDLDGDGRAALRDWLAKPPQDLARALGVEAKAIARLVEWARERGLEGDADADGELEPQPRRPGRPRGSPPPRMHAEMLGVLLGGAQRNGGPRGVAARLHGDEARHARPTLEPDELPDLDATLVAALAAEGVQTLEELAAADPLDLIGIGGLRYSVANKLVLLARRRAETRDDAAVEGKS